MNAAIISTVTLMTIMMSVPMPFPSGLPRLLKFALGVVTASFRPLGTKVATTRRKSTFNSTSPAKQMYKIVEKGSPNTLDYRLFLESENGPVSPFHDIPLFANSEKRIYNMIVEVPRWTNAKMEIATSEPLNPLKQDVKKGNLRFVANCFPHHGYIWNYGAMPQTWEDPSHIDESTGCKGDNDPIDVCEIGFRVAKRGEVIQVKVLGTFALIDEGETDWKVLAIDVNDPMADKLNDIKDINTYMPGFLKATHEWFKIYKMPDGKPENKFAFDGEPMDKEFAENIIDTTHKAWENLISNKSEKAELSCSTVTTDDSPYKISQSDATDIVTSKPELGPSEPVDPIVNKWHYVTL